MGNGGRDLLTAICKGFAQGQQGRGKERYSKEREALGYVEHVGVPTVGPRHCVDLIRDQVGENMVTSQVGIKGHHSDLIYIVHLIPFAPR